MFCLCRHLVGHTGISDAWETLGRSCLTEGRKIKLHGQCLQEDGLLPHREPLPAWSLVPVQPSPSGLRCIPGGQMHMKVPMRFLQSIPRVSQSCSPSAHSSRSATENLVRPRPTCQLCGTGRWGEGQLGTQRSHLRCSASPCCLGAGWHAAHTPR